MHHVRGMSVPDITSAWIQEHRMLETLQTIYLLPGDAVVTRYYDDHALPACNNDKYTVTISRKPTLLIYLLSAPLGNLYSRLPRG